MSPLGSSLTGFLCCQECDSAVRPSQRKMRGDVVTRIDPSSLQRGYKAALNPSFFIFIPLFFFIGYTKRIYIKTITNEFTFKGGYCIMRTVKAEQLRKLLQRKDRMITLRMNPELLRLLDEALEKDKDFQNRNELIESLILRYLESKGKI